MSRYKGWSAVDFADHVQIVVTDPSDRTIGQNFGVLSPGIWRVEDLAMNHALILAGVGWGNLPEWMVRDDLATRRLARVPSLHTGTEGDSALVGYLIPRAGPSRAVYSRPPAEPVKAMRRQSPCAYVVG